MAPKFDDHRLYALLKGEDYAAIDAFLAYYGLDSVDRDGRTFLISAVAEQKEALVEHLLQQGSDVNAADDQGLTALHFAAICNNEVLALRLIDHGALLDAKDHHGNTPLWRAVMRHHSAAKVVNALLAAGAEAHLKNDHGVSPAYLMSLR